MHADRSRRLATSLRRRRASNVTKRWPVELAQALRVLGVEDNADEATINAAFRRRARAAHPDTSAAPDAEDVMRELNRARDSLRDRARERVAIEAPGAATPPTDPPVVEAPVGGAAGVSDPGLEGVFGTTWSRSARIRGLRPCRPEPRIEARPPLRLVVRVVG